MCVTNTVYSSQNEISQNDEVAVCRCFFIMSVGLSSFVSCDSPQFIFLGLPVSESFKLVIATSVILRSIVVLLLYVRPRFKSHGVSRRPKHEEATVDLPRNGMA